MRYLLLLALLAGCAPKGKWEQVSLPDRECQVCLGDGIRFDYSRNGTIICPECNGDGKAHPWKWVPFSEAEASLHNDDRQWMVAAVLVGGMIGLALAFWLPANPWRTKT